MPIIKSLLDLDYYKITMGQVVFRHFRGTPVVYGFRNRTKGVCLPEVIDETALREELKHIRGLRFKPEEIDYLRESPFIPKGVFSEDYLEYLGRLEMPPFFLEPLGQTYRIEVEGPWETAIYWETLILSVVNELYYRSLMDQKDTDPKAVIQEGNRRLQKKIKILKEHPGIRFSDFGTRRRFSGPWQLHIVQTLAKEVPGQLSGTSNVLLAKELGLPPIGTFAHEMDMVLSGICHESEDAIRKSHKKVLEAWWETYAERYSIALTDTYGTDFFFSDFSYEQALKWRGLRQDSGDPFAFAQKAIAFYLAKDIDPRTKLLVFSDGLWVEQIVELYERFKDQIQVTFGWGTNLDNDLGFDPLSLIVKAIRSCGHGTVKLSDNRDKALGENEDVERFKKIFGCGEIPSLGVRY